MHYGEVSNKATTVNSRSLRTGYEARFNVRLEHTRRVPGKAVLVHNHPVDASKAPMYRRDLRLIDEVQPIVAALISVKPKTEALGEVLKGKVAARVRSFPTYV